MSHWNDTFEAEIAGHTPDWAERYPAEAERHGPQADALGIALARRWVDLI